MFYFRQSGVRVARNPFTSATYVDQIAVNSSQISAVGVLPGNPTASVSHKAASVPLPAGLFLITAGTNNPEMVNVLASSKDERNTWMTIIQDAMHCM